MSIATFLPLKVNFCGCVCLPQGQHASQMAKFDLSQSAGERAPQETKVMKEKIIFE